MSKSGKLPFFGHMYFVCSNGGDVRSASNCLHLNFPHAAPALIRSFSCRYSVVNVTTNPILVIETTMTTATSAGRGRSWVRSLADHSVFCDVMRRRVLQAEVTSPRMARCVAKPRLSISNLLLRLSFESLMKKVIIPSKDSRMCVRSSWLFARAHHVAVHSSCHHISFFQRALLRYPAVHNTEREGGTSCAAAALVQP